MRRAFATLAAALGLELLVATACIGSNVQPSVVPSPTQTARPSPAPVATLPAEQDSILQKTIIDYYTAGQGQQHYDDNLYHDLLLTRFYIYDPTTEKMGVVVRVEGTINGLVEGNGLLYFDISRVGEGNDAQIYTDFVRTALPTPEIDYHQAPRGQGIYVINDPSVPVHVGIVGKLPTKPPVRNKDPFGILMSLPPEVRGRKGILKHTSPTTGDEIYVQPVAHLIQNSKVLTFTDVNGQPFQVPAQGSILLEIVVLDTQHLANAALLTGLTSIVEPGVPRYK